MSKVQSQFSSTSSRSAVRFRKTDQIEALLRALVQDYYSDRNKTIGKKELRRKVNELFVSMQAGARNITIDKVGAR
jgi:vacuolar-type H+-ATPase subunit C/Vma6